MKDTWHFHGISQQTQLQTVQNHGIFMHFPLKFLKIVIVGLIIFVFVCRKYFFLVLDIFIDGFSGSGCSLFLAWDAGRFCVHWGIMLPDICCTLQSVCLPAVARATKQMCIGIRFRRLKGSGINHPSKKEKLSLFALCVCPSNKSLFRVSLRKTPQVRPNTGLCE